MITGIPKTRWARTVDGACIAYQDLGEGPITLVVIHGWVSHLEIYWEQPRFARFMRRLSRNMRVLHFDKRGVGMSDRLSSAPGLDIQMDDIRAVMDAAGIERGAVFGWGSAGPALAAVFAATYPERTLALCLDGLISQRRTADFPWGFTEAEEDESLAQLVSAWGDDDRALEFVREGFGDRPEDAPVDDGTFLCWCARFARCAATPASYEAFDRMWYETDVRDVLPAVHVPTLVLSKPDLDTEHQALNAYMLDRIPGARLATVPGFATVVWVEEPEAYVAAIESFITSVQHEEQQLDRMLATVLFTDVVGSTDKVCEMGDACWAKLLDQHNATVRAFLARYRGTEVKTMGDGFLATFDGPARAVKCAQAICAAVKPLGLEVRAGCHTGEIELLGADVGGIAVHIGARVGALAGPSEVLVSSTVKDLVAGSGLVFSDRGKHRLKGVPEPWQLYAAEA
jgi:class 3 adenylate cyclase